MHIVSVGRVWLLVPALLLGSVAILSGGAGCSEAKVKTSQEWGWELPTPDKLIVHDFAVTAAEAKLDRTTMTTGTALRDAQDRNVSDGEARLGHLVSEKLSKTLVEELNKAGITAVRAGPNVTATDKSLVMTGVFLNIDDGNKTSRLWIGFGLGGEKLRTNLQAFQAKKMVAEAQTTTDTELKPAMATSGGAGFSEKVTATADEDARRTAKAIVKEVQAAYQRRGWVVKAG